VTASSDGAGVGRDVSIPAAGAGVTGRLRIRAGAVLAGTLLLVAATAAPASAHNRLVSTDPADGASLARTPTAVVLTFNEPAVPLGSQVLVTGPDGPAGSGPVQLIDNTVRQPLAAGAPAGRYTVDWRVTARDGHPLSGRFSFVTEASAPGQADTPREVPAAAANPPAAAGRWLLLALLLAGAGGTLGVLLRRQGRAR